MQRFSIPTLIISIFTVIAAIIFVATLARAFLPLPSSFLQVPEMAAPVELALPEEAPITLIIPRLGIETNVQHRGIDAEGNMAAPTNFSDVSWYSPGVVPGQRGSAVMAGHVDNALGLSGVFKRLGELNPGDEVIVVTQEGTRLTFEVADLEVYHYLDAPLERIFNAEDARRLNLVTCAGTWQRGEQTYDERLVVYTVYTGQ